MSGNFLEIDEFGSLRIEKIDDDEREIKSPVKSKVLKLEDDKITLEFEAKEFKGEGVIEGKSWGKTTLKEINDVKDLNSLVSGEILFTNNLSRLFLLKAEVVGVSAVVTKLTDVSEVEIDLPVLRMESSDWDELLGLGDGKDVLVNSRLGRLLVVIE